MGIRQIATEMALKGLPLVGQLVHFKENWQATSSDPWVLKTVFGYDFVDQPHQTKPPQELTFSKEEQQSLREEIQSMQSKHAVSEVGKPVQHARFHFPIVSCPKKRWWSETSNQPQAVEYVAQWTSNVKHNGPQLQTSQREDQ